METHTLQFRFNATFTGNLMKPLYDKSNGEAIETAKNLFDENPMIEEIIVWFDGDKIATIKDELPEITKEDLRDYQGFQ